MHILDNLNNGKVINSLDKNLASGTGHSMAVRKLPFYFFELGQLNQSKLFFPAFFHPHRPSLNFLPNRFLY